MSCSFNVIPHFFNFSFRIDKESCSDSAYNLVTSEIFRVHDIIFFMDFRFFVGKQCYFKLFFLYELSMGFFAIPADSQNYRIFGFEIFFQVAETSGFQVAARSIVPGIKEQDCTLSFKVFKAYLISFLVRKAKVW